MNSPASQDGNTELHINEIVLEGFPPADGSRVVAALRQELQRLLGESKRAIRDGDLTHLDAGSVSYGTPEETGKQVARNLYRGLMR